MSRVAWGPDTEVIAALGLGRSYGAHSRLIIRSLPGILESGLWRTIDAMPPAPSVGVVADVGNDILYGYAPEQILRWVDEAVTRLQRHTTDIALTGLPFHNVDQLSERRFRLMRAVMFPSSTQTLAGARASSVVVQAGLERIAAERALRFIRLQPHWYGWDPIHFRYQHWRHIWGDFLGLGRDVAAAPPERGGLLESARLWLRADEHRWILGMHQHTPQHGKLQLY
jgi:hypothetical protein